MKFSRAVQLLAGVVIAFAGLSLFFRKVDIDRLLIEISSVSPWALFACACLSIVLIVLRAARWKHILPRMEGTHEKNLFSHTIIGFMINNIVPARMGEAARAFLLWRDNRYPAAVCLGSLVVERAIDLLVFMLFFVIPVMMLPQLELLLPVAWIVLAIIIVVIVVFMLYALFAGNTSRAAKRLLNVLPGRLNKTVSKVSVQLVSNLDWIFSFQRTLSVIGLTLGISFCYSAMMIILAGDYRSFGVVYSLFAQSFAAIGSAIPLAPGYIGTIHAALLYGLNLVGVEEEKGRALAILFHAINYMPITLLGLFYFFRAKISFSEIDRVKRELKR